MANLLPVRIIWVNGPTVSLTEANQLDTNTIALVNGDLGGTWAPSSALIIGGLGMTCLGPWTLSNGLIKTPVGSGKRIVHGDADYLVLSGGHTGNTRVIQQLFAEYPCGPPAGFNNAVLFLESIFPGQVFSVQLRPHHASTVTQVVFEFAVIGSRAGMPAILPKFRVVRRDVNGRASPLTSQTSGADVNGWKTLPTPASSAAYVNGNAAQAFTLACDQNNVIDTSSFVYAVEVTEESGANAFAAPGLSGATNGNAWFTIQATYASIADMRPQQ